jgi:type IV secretory pathway TrbL component
VPSTNIQTLRDQLLQQLNATGSSSQDASSGSSPLGDLLTLSPAAQQLTQAPAAVTQAMTDLLSGKQVAQADLTQLQTFLQNNPQSLSSLISGIQGSKSTYGASNASGASDTLLTALMNQQSNASNPGDLLSLLGNNQGQDPLLASLSDSGSGSDGTLSSLFG